MKITATKIPPKAMEYYVLLLKNAKAVGLLLLMTILWSLPSMAQGTINVRGRIADEKNQPIAGASISVKGTTVGTTTDNNGAFQINAPANGTLVVSSVGFGSKEIPVNNEATQNITLTAATQSLEQVVVVGYGTQRKKDVTGAVASVNMDALRDVPNTSLGQYLQGTVPGLNVGVSTVAGGTPPIAIRGQVSLSGNQNVLIILDGIQYSGSLSSINPDDIASIDVLKDPSSTAVYGAQAANGVILITSRRGRINQKPRIAFSTSYGTQEPTVGNLKPKNRAEYLAGLTEAYYDRAYLGPDFTQPNPSFNVATVVDASMKDASGNILPNDFDWWGEGTKTGTIWDNTLSISGGGDKFSYLLSGGYLDQKGFIINDIFKRKSIRANLETRPLNWLKVGLLSSAGFVNQDGAEPTLDILQHSSPLLVPFDASGNLIPFPTNTLEPNPFTTYYVDNHDRNNQFFATIYTDIDFPFVKGLNYHMNFGNNYRTAQKYNSSIYAAGQTGEAYKSNQQYYDYTFDNILTYTKTIDRHNITATLLYGAVERKFDSSLARATGFSRLTLGYNNLSLGTNQFTTSDSWKEALNYQMARVNYKYNDRYLLTATVRRDGFSGFAEDHKYAVFPSAAIGWIISQEDFMKNVKVVNSLKLRVGYGESGNQTTRYSSLSRVLAGTPNAYIYGDGSTPAFGQVVGTLGNPDLKWERTKGFNAGVDFALFGNQTTGSLDFYNNNTKDLLFGVFVPTISGFDTITTNLGHIRNTGFEASITQQIFNKKDFTWSATLNFSTNKNKIITLTGVDANGDGKEDDLIADSLFIGKSVHVIYDYQADGIYQISDTKLPGFKDGTVRPVDQNKDGNITPEADRVFQGRQEPAYRVSLLNTLFYKGFTLSFLLNSVQGGSDGYRGLNRPFANNRAQYFREDNSVRWNDLKGIDYWSPSNPDGKYPRNISGSRVIEPGQYYKRNFVRLQDVSLSYNLANIVNTVKFQSLTLYVSGKNIATWTDWEGWDPETGEGVVIGGRPVLRAFTVGLNIIY